ncbi:carboxymuconolactone decarboxylase family protein [Mycolicibacterium sp. XJ1819]
MSSGDAALDRLIRTTCGRALALPALPVRDDGAELAPERESVVAAFAEQFSVDVSGITDDLRSHLLIILGDNAFRTVVSIFVADFVPRVWAGCAALGLDRPGEIRALSWDRDSDPVDALLNGFVPAVARMRALDPVTTEIVRLRGATQHNCRLCKSRRESSALDAGGSEDLYGQIERYETAEGLSAAHRAALQYVDALIWSPSQIGAEVVAGVRTYFTEGQALELTLDIMRNAANKIAVSLAADAPLVTEGTELFRVDADGQTVPV